MLAADPLDPAHQTADVQRRNNPQDAADQRTNDADDGALNHEDRHDLPRRGADGAQDGDVCALVVDHHDQRGNDVERCHGNDHQQQQTDHGLFHLHGTEQAALGVGPVIGAIAITQTGGDGGGHLRRLVQIL